MIYLIIHISYRKMLMGFMQFGARKREMTSELARIEDSRRVFPLSQREFDALKSFAEGGGRADKLLTGAVRHAFDGKRFKTQLTGADLEPAHASRLLERCVVKAELAPLSELIQP